MLAAEGCLKDRVAHPSACKLLHSRCLYGFLKDEACFCKFPVYVRLWGMFQSCFSPLACRGLNFPLVHR